MSENKPKFLANLLGNIMGEYFHIKMKRKSKDHYRGDSELGCKAGRMELPTFDGSNQISATAWVQKLDAYLQLNTMEEGNAIKFATLYLMGKAHDWWFHGMTTLGHEHVTSYRDFTQRLIDRFDARGRWMKPQEES
jgi:hypothetical protein